MLTLAVTGTAHRLVPAERAVLRVRIRVEHADRTTAVEGAAALQRRLSAEAEAHVASGAASRWSADQVFVRGTTRGFDEVEPSERVQLATAELSVRFSDFRAMSAWLTEVTELAGVEIPGIEWTVTDARRAEVEREVRAAAVRQAQEHAAEYAAELGSASYRLRALYEPGLRPGQRPVDRGESLWSAQSADRGPEFTLRPEEIRISASVDADYDLD